MKSIFFLILTLWLTLSYKAFALRDPFSCRHAHGKMMPQAAEIAPKIPTHPERTFTIADDPSSEWRVIAEKDSTIIMQHKDGSIREIVVHPSTRL